LKKHRPSQQPNTKDASAEAVNAPTMHWRIDGWFKDLLPEQKTRLKAYHDELCRFNKTLNLVSPKSLFNADAVHFADSILSYQIVEKKLNKNIELFDIGSGNGFPGLVFSALDPELKVVLLDVDQRKCEFLKHTISVLGLKNTTVENLNVEKVEAGRMQQAICRGFAPLPRALLGFRKLFNKGGNVFFLKSEEWSLELAQVPSQLCSLWSPSHIGGYEIPSLSHKMHVILASKIA
jgi:16S rRNA (guanine527-N7)-methyltransferase